MPDDSYKPAGYCPRCGYALDPGKCPECGATVKADQLVCEPNHVASRRRMRLAAVLALVAVVVLGGYCLYREGAWLTWLPNGLLLWFERSDWPRADREILARYRAGRFSKDEVDGLLRRAFGVLAVYAQHVPANTPMPVSVVLAPTGPLRPRLQELLGSLSKDEWTIQCEGRKLVPLQATGFPFHHGFAEVRLELPPLSIGQHDLVLKGSLREPSSSVQHAISGCVWSVELQLSIVAEERPLEDFVAERWNAELASAFAKSIRMGGCVWDGIGKPALEVCLDSLPTAIAFEVFVRSSEGGEYRPLTGWGGAYPREFPQGTSCTFGLLLPEEAWGTGRIDVQLRPRPQEALLRELDECFMGTIEWRGLVIPKENPSDSRSNTVPPTRVFRQTGEAWGPSSASSPATGPQ